MTGTRILTVRQPWAYAIVIGQKDVENRDYSTTHRGPVIIHAGLRVDETARVKYPELFTSLPPDAALATGAIIGVVDLVDVVPHSESPWALGTAFHWVLENARYLPEPIPYPGALGLRHVTSAALLNTIESALTAGRS